MGSGSFDAKAYFDFTSSTVGKATDDIYSARRISKNLDPKGVLVRESRDSADNPQSTPLIGMTTIRTSSTHIKVGCGLLRLM